METSKIIIIYMAIVLIMVLPVLIHLYYPAIKTAWKKHLLTCDTILASNI